MADQLFNLGSNGVTTSAGYEEDGQIITTETMPGSVVQAILDSNQAIRNAGNVIDQTRKTGLGVIGARIPVTMHYRWRREWKNGPRAWGMPWHVFLKRRLNSAEYKHLRFMNL